MGRGVYCTTAWEKAADYLKGPFGGVVLVLRIRNLGKCKELERNDPMMTTWQDNGYDSAWAPFSAVNPNDQGKQENCVKDPKRIQVINVIPGDEKKLRWGGYDIIDNKLTKVRTDTTRPQQVAASESENESESESENESERESESESESGRESESKKESERFLLRKRGPQPVYY